MLTPNNQGDSPEGSPSSLVPPSTLSQPNQNLSPELFERMLDNQADEIQLKREELAFKEREDQRGYDFAIHSLSVQAQDRREMRVSGKGYMTRTYVFFFLCLVVVLVAGAYALALGKDQLVLEIAKLAGTFFSGGAAGYGLRSAKKAKENNEDEDS